MNRRSLLRGKKIYILRVTPPADGPLLEAAGCVAGGWLLLAAGWLVGCTGCWLDGCLVGISLDGVTLNSVSEQVLGTVIARSDENVAARLVV